MKKQAFNHWFVGICCTLLVGCATSLKQPDKSNTAELWHINKARLSQLKVWQLKAKIAVKTGRRGGSAALTWDYNKLAQKIELSGPIGSKRIVLRITPTGATLHDTNGQYIEGNNGSQVLQSKLGWSIPFAPLTYWIKGLPNPGASHLKFNHRGQLKHLQHGYWNVDYLTYQTVNGVSLPRALNITTQPDMPTIYSQNDEPLGDQFKLKIIVKHWSDLVFES